MAKRAPKSLPGQDYLWLLLNYDPESGALTWKPRPREMFQSERIFRSWNAKNAGKPAFTMLGQNGYLYGAIWGEKYLAHRIIFKMMTGRDPIAVDHVDGQTAYNAWANLREANQTENMRNAALPSHNTSGRVGVHWYAPRGKWLATIKVNRKSKCLGYFVEKSDAIAAREAAEQRYGFHANHGRSPHG